MQPRLALLLVGLLLLTMLLVDVASMQHLSITYDEPNHYRYGEQILNRNSTRFLDSTMPATAANALPAAIARELPRSSFAVWLGRVETGRYVTVLASLLVALCIFAWARDLHGTAGGILSLALYAFDPNFLAHSQLITTDVYAAGGVAIALYMFWRYLRRGGGWRSTTAAAVALGAAQLVKYSCLPLYPLCAVIAVGFHAPDLWRNRNAGARDMVRRLGRFTRDASLIAVIGLVIINAGFLFNRTFTPLREYHFRSTQFQTLQAKLRRVGSVPVPVPYPYVEGLDWIVQRERSGEGYGNVYLLGETRSGRGFAGYYLYATLYKLPLASLLAVLAGLGAWVSRQRRSGFLRDEWVLLCPIVFFTISFNVFDRAQIGLRHFMVVFPLLYILAGALVRLRPSPVGMTALAIGAVALVASVASYYPLYLTYFNELVWNRRMTWTVLADSNLDWGQHRWYLQRYRAAHPDAIIDPARPTAGRILVGVNALTGVAYGPERFRWLRDNFTPVDDIAHSVIVYDVSPAELERVTGPSASVGRRDSPDQKGTQRAESVRRR